MDSRNYELAAEFCKLVGTPDLLTYLGLAADVEAGESRKKLKSRRKYMQGMQSNPKYRNEALYIIKHFAALDAVLADPGTYLGDAAKRAESVHLPILEMTIKGVLAGGSLSADQEEYLRRNALELGVTVETFEEILQRLASDAQVKRPGGPPSTVPAASTPYPEEVGNYYLLLKVERDAKTEDIGHAYRARIAEAEAQPPGPGREALMSRLSLAWNTLADPTTRDLYEISQTRTGPPARARDVRPDQAATAPPVRRVSRPSTPGGLPGRLEILGDPVRYVQVASSPVSHTINIRNGGDRPMAGQVTRDEPWLIIETQEIDPNQKEQGIIVHIAPEMMDGDRATGTVTLQTDSGDQATILFDVQRIGPLRQIARVVAALLVVIAFVSFAGWGLGVFGGGGSIQINVDPLAEVIQLDGVTVGSGEGVTIDNLPTGPVTLQVTHPAFQPYSRDLNSIDRSVGVVDVVLDLAHPLDFKPTRTMKRGAFSQESAAEVVGARATGFDRCVRKSAEVGQILNGTIRVHINPEGRAIGMEVEGKNTDRPDVHKCLARQAAVISFDPLNEGDYATVRYNYAVTPE